jgi:hypothetical protein
MFEARGEGSKTPVIGSWCWETGTAASIPSCRLSITLPLETRLSHLNESHRRAHALEDLEHEIKLFVGVRRDV